MLKLTGCILLVLSCSLMGVMKANTYKYRTKELENIIELIKLIDMNIIYRKEPLAKAFEKASAARKCWFSCVLNDCSVNMKQRYDLRESWRLSIGHNIENSPLTSDDISIIEAMIIGLGKSDSDGQKRILDPVVSRLSINHKAAQSRENSLGRMYRTIGIATGIVIAILII